jgi:hypothetical protein
VQPPPPERLGPQQPEQEPPEQPPEARLA